MTINNRLANGIERLSDINDQLYTLKESIHGLELAGHILMAPLAVAFGNQGFRHLAAIPRLGMTMMFNHKKHELMHDMAHQFANYLRNGPDDNGPGNNPGPIFRPRPF